MKKISILLSIFFITFVKSQAFSDYKYVVIPKEFPDFKNNRSFGLDGLLENTLKGKKYTVLPETKSSWPSEALINPCAVLNAEILDVKSMFRNKVIVQFKDCNNQVVFTQKASSPIKEFEPGYQDALKQALMKMPVSKPAAITGKSADAKLQEVIKEAEQTATIEVHPPTNVAQRFTKGNLSLQRIQIAEDQFILVDGNSSVPFATFRSTAKKDVYRVKLGTGESTIGYFENGNITIEMPKSNGEFSNEVFSAQ